MMNPIGSRPGPVEISPATYWEIAIKITHGRYTLPPSVRGAADYGEQLLRTGGAFDFLPVAT
jgi:hypothetical protein